MEENSRLDFGDELQMQTSVENNKNSQKESPNKAFQILKDLRIRNYNKIIIGNLNINSIANKFDQLKLLIQGKFDILVIIETKLDESFPTAPFLIDGFFEPYRRNRNRNGGGILIYIKDDISGELRTVPFSTL